MSGSKPLWTPEDRKALLDAYRLTALSPEEFCALPRRPHPTTFREWLREEDMEPQPWKPSTAIIREVRSLRRDLRATQEALQGTLGLLKKLNERVHVLEMQNAGRPYVTQGERVNFVQDTSRRIGE